MIDPLLVAFGGVVVLAYAIQSATGLGGMVICVTLGAHFFPVNRVLALAIPLSVAQTAYVCIRHYDTIDRRLLFAQILPVMALGAVLGVWVASDLAQPLLRMLLGVLVLGLALRELWARFRNVDRSKPLSAFVFHSVVFSAGIVHGLFATGGPPLVYALARRGLDRHAFRSTISAVWFTLNLVLACQYVWAGRYDRATSLDVLRLVPAIPVGIFVGEVVHRRVDEKSFQTFLYVVLALAALALLVR